MSTHLAVRTVRIALVVGVLASTAFVVRPDVDGGSDFVVIALALALIAGLGSAWSP